MQANKKAARVAGFLLGFLGSFGGIGCIVTGLRFEGISLLTIAVFCFITALITAVLAGRKLLGVAVAGFLLAGLWSWQKGSLNVSLEAFLHHISRLYDMGYGWGVIRWSNNPLSVNMAQPVLCALGILTALGICWSFLRCKGIWLTAFLISAPVIPCMVLVDTPPSAACLFIQLLCVLLLLMIRLTRKHQQDIALIKLLALPAAAALLALFLFIPQKTYSSFKPVDLFLSYIQELFTEHTQTPPAPPVQQEGSWVNLSTVGPKGQQRGVVMDVTADQSGNLYLKGAAYDTYHGTWWDCAAAAPAIPLPQTAAHRVTVTTRAIHDVLYLPYGAYGIGNEQLFYPERDGQVANQEGWHSYSVQYRELPNSENLQITSTEALNAYTQLPNATRRKAMDYLSRELPQLQTTDAADGWSQAKAIVRHVSSSADYDLQTPKMPSGEKDFALWFLEESDTGYCIHFASAATVLLRAAGIPCRYVTGYLVSAQAGQSVEVQRHNAHAWVECYIDGIGWVPLEPTPGNGLLETTGTETTAPTETATAPQFTQPTENTQETTAPLQTEASTEHTTLPNLVTKPSEDISDIGGADGPSVNNGAAEKPSKPSRLLIWVAATVCAIAAIVGQWRLRVMLRQKKCRRGKRNAQALARWRLVVLHCRVRKEEPDSTLLALAQKARFSHHTLTGEELQAFDDWIASSTQQLRQLNLWKQFLATVIFALY